MEISTLLFSFIIAFSAIFIGCVSGGTGLILRPLLIFLGISPTVVVGTVRFAAVFGDAPSLYLLHKHKKIDWKLVLILTAPTFIGSLIASVAVVSILKSSLEVIIGALLLIMGTILLINKNIGLKEKKYNSSNKYKNIIAFFVTLIISFFNAITGGLGPLYTSFYVFYYGKTYISASALGKTASYIGASITSLVFVISGVVDWQLFAVLVLAFVLGSYFGTRFSLKKGERWIKSLMLLIVFVSAMKMIFF